ncbi:Fic family protein [Larkinella punicea]|uniref:Fic family protein n=1 Tax=Larkinella punicea TaxID=2315727 RepID=UPI001E461AB2|nr:Fic family protein [Larkinella punicea]
MKRLEKPPKTKKLVEFLIDPVSTIIIEQFSEYNQLVKQINDEYLYWDKAKYKLPNSLKNADINYAEGLWQLAKVRREIGQKSLKFAKHPFILSLPDLLYSQLHHFDLHLGGSLGGQSELSESDKHQYLIGSIMEESIASSQIEGAITSRIVAKDMLRKNRPPRNKSEQMILNNYQTIQHILQIKSQPLTSESLLEIHRLITADTMEKPEETGQFRQHDDIHVVDAIEGEVIHTPPSHTTLPAFIEDLCGFFNDETPKFFIHPVVKASIIHFLIGYFHPFTDGNGRTARALFYWYLLKKGYWLTEYLSISRVILQSRMQYYRAFQYTEADENDLTYFVIYQVKTLRKAYEELKKYIDRKNTEKKQLVSFQRIEGISLRQAQIIKLIQEDADRILNVKEIENRFGVSNQTARNDLQQLVDMAFLEKVSVNRKEQRFVKSRQFDQVLKKHLSR